MHVYSPNIRNRGWVWWNDRKSTIQEMLGYIALGFWFLVAISKFCLLYYQKAQYN